MLLALPALSNARPQGAQVGPAIFRAGNYTPALRPLEFFLWTHRKSITCCFREITAFGQIYLEPEHIASASDAYVSLEESG